MLKAIFTCLEVLPRISNAPDSRLETQKRQQPLPEENKPQDALVLIENLGAGERIAGQLLSCTSGGLLSVRGLLSELGRS